MRAVCVCVLLCCTLFFVFSLSTLNEHTQIVLYACLLFDIPYPEISENNNKLQIIAQNSSDKKDVDGQLLT